MNKETKYIPPEFGNGISLVGAFESINKPTAGSAYDQKLPRGKHTFAIILSGYAKWSKNNIDVRELLALGHEGAEYDAWLCRINKGEQFSSGFVEINPIQKFQRY